MSYREIILPILVQRKDELEDVIKKSQRGISAPVEGYLEVNKNRGHYRYYYRDARENSITKSGRYTGNQSQEHYDVDHQGNIGNQSRGHSDTVSPGYADNQSQGHSDAGSQGYTNDPTQGYTNDPTQEYTNGSTQGHSGDKPPRKYLRDLDLAKKIANRDYSRQVLQSASRELKQINALLNAYQSSTAEECFQKLHPGRQILVKPLLLDDEQYSDLWMKKSCESHHNSYPINSPIQTENHEIVRSKSEKIIADKLSILGIPYVYERPLRLGKVTKYPDFTVLNKRTRKEFYWEHLGLMDQPEYFRDAMKKLETYFQNKILPGKNLIITFETSGHPLNIEMIEQMIYMYLV